MHRTRFTATITVALASAAIAAPAMAQRASVEDIRTGQFVTAGLSATTPAAFGNTGASAVALPIVAQTAASTERVDLVAESMPSDRWGAIPLHESTTDADGEENERSSEAGFFSSTTGRMSLIGLAGLAGAGYVALSAGDGAATSRSQASPISPTTGPGTAGITGSADVIVNPEPASLALMALGLGALGLAVRARRTR